MATTDVNSPSTAASRTAHTSAPATSPLAGAPLAAAPVGAASVTPAPLLVPAPDRPTALRLPRELRGTSTRSIVLSWLISRALVLTLLVTIESTVTGDVSYYARSLHTLFHGGSIREVLQEYPLPVLAIMLPQYLVGAMNALAFSMLFALSMLVVDGLFTWTLWRVGGRQRTDAVRFWLWFVPALGPISYFRFDLIPAMLAGAAVLCAARRPGWSGSLTAIGAALKLWPALMLPTFLLNRGDRKRVVTSFLLTGGAIGVSALAIGGVGRLLSPLNWQGSRGLQIESVTATPLLIARELHPHHVWAVRISRYKAYEIFGWGVHVSITLTSLFTAAGLGVLAWLWLRARAVHAVSAETVGWLFIATALVVTITNKTLSPQYILWLGGPLAALMARAPGAAVMKAGRLLLLICLLTQLEFPLTYNGLTHDNLWYSPVAWIALGLRNILLTYLAYYACRQVWQQTRRA